MLICSDRFVQLARAIEGLKYHPAEGRGPIGKVRVTKREGSLIAYPNWVPAYAGVDIPFRAWPYRANASAISLREFSTPYSAMKLPILGPCSDPSNVSYNALNQSRRFSNPPVLPIS